jgi:hypothetical protein
VGEAQGKGGTVKAYFKAGGGDGCAIAVKNRVAGLARHRKDPVYGGAHSILCK